jgi:Resolvase, N terminal domain
MVLVTMGYVRVSKQEQNEALQRDALKEAGCEKYFSDKMTGSKFERKGLEELLAFVRSGDTVVVWKLDRLGRSLKDLIETLNLLKDRGVDFISLTEKIDTTTPGGKLIFHVMGAISFVSEPTLAWPLHASCVPEPILLECLCLLTGDYDDPCQQEPCSPGRESETMQRLLFACAFLYPPGQSERRGR